MQLPDQDLMLKKSLGGQEEETTRRVLAERNVRRLCAKRLFAQLSASAQRRHDVLQLRASEAKLRRRRMIRKIEYQRLRTMVPSIAKKPLVSKVTVIEEAIRYIDYLHGALLIRLRTKGLPSCLQGANVDVNQLSLEDIKNLVCQMVENNSASEDVFRRETQRSSSGRTRRGMRQQSLPVRPAHRKRT